MVFDINFNHAMVSDMNNFEPTIDLETEPFLTYEDPDWLALYDFEQEVIESNCKLPYDDREAGVDRDELWPLGWDLAGEEPNEIVECDEDVLTAREEDDEFRDSIERQFMHYLRVRAEINSYYRPRGAEI